MTWLIAEMMHFDASATTLVGWLLSGLSKVSQTWEVIQIKRLDSSALTTLEKCRTGRAVLCLCGCLVQAHRELPNLEGKMWN